MYKDGKENMTATGIRCPVASSGVLAKGKVLALRLQHVLALQGHDVCIVKAHNTQLFGFVWLQTKYGSRGPNTVTTVVDSVVNSFQLG